MVRRKSRASPSREPGGLTQPGPSNIPATPSAPGELTTSVPEVKQAAVTATDILAVTQIPSRAAPREVTSEPATATTDRAGSTQKLPTNQGGPHNPISYAAATKSAAVPTMTLPKSVLHREVQMPASWGFEENRTAVFEAPPGCTEAEAVAALRDAQIWSVNNVINFYKDAKRNLCVLTFSTVAEMERHLGKCIVVGVWSSILEPDHNKSLRVSVLRVHPKIPNRFLAHIFSAYGKGIRVTTHRRTGTDSNNTKYSVGSHIRLIDIHTRNSTIIPNTITITDKDGTRHELTVRYNGQEYVQMYAADKLTTSTETHREPDAVQDMDQDQQNTDTPTGDDTLTLVRPTKRPLDGGMDSDEPSSKALYDANTIPIPSTDESDSDREEGEIDILSEEEQLILSDTYKVQLQKLDEPETTVTPQDEFKTVREKIVKGVNRTRRTSKTWFFRKITAALKMKAKEVEVVRLAILSKLKNNDIARDVQVSDLDMIFGAQYSRLKHYAYLIGNL